MADPSPPRDDDDRARHEVEAGGLALGDPEGAPATAAGSLAVLTALGERLGGGGTGKSAEIWRLAWPVMLSQMLASVVGLVDIAMVGRLGPAAQAAVGYASQLFFLTQSALFALGFACVALMARAIGARDPARARRVFAASLGVALAVASVLAAAVLAAPERLLALLSAEPDVIAYCVPYLRLVMGSALLLALALTAENALRADRDTRTPMRIAVVVTAVKIGLNVLLIFGVAGFPRLELVGAGLATVGSQVVAVALFGWVIARSPADGPRALRPADFRGVRRHLPALVRIALPGVGERLVMNLAMLSYFAFLGSYGTVAAAAYTIGIRILSFSWIPGIGYSQAVATLVGQGLGASDPEAARLAGRRAARLALGTAIVMGVVGAVAREPLARLFTVDAETIRTLGPFMLCLALAQPAMQLHFTLAGVHRGAGDTWTPLFAALVGNWAVRVPLAWALAHPLGAPLVAVWAVLILDHLARAGWLVTTFRRGRWLRTDVPGA